MDDRRRTLAAITLIVGFFILVAIIAGIAVSSKKTISPVPEDNSAIKIIFVTPTPTAPPTPKATVEVTPTSKPTVKTTPKLTVKPTATPTPKSATSSGTITPTP